MTIRSLSALFAFLLLLVPASLLAKGKTVKIAVAGAAISAPIEMTGPGLEVFNVWEGPGCFLDGKEQKEGFIIDWENGTVSERPLGLAQYKLQFFAEGKSEARLVYEVVYEYEPSTGKGFVYLPTSELNMRALYRGREGNWFRATDEWQEAFRSALTP